MNRTTNLHDHYDVLICGARCAGAATAMLLARCGLRVLAIDRSPYGSDTLSTHALMRAGVVQLSRWGLLEAVKQAGTPTIATTSFHYGDEVVRVPIKSSSGVDGLYAPRRAVLDRLLVDAARAAGAHVRHGARLVGLKRSPAGRVCGAIVRPSVGAEVAIGAALVIGADGLASLVAQQVRAEAYRVGLHATTTVYGYWSGLAVAGSQWHYAPGAGAGVIPTNDGLTCVFVALPPERFRRQLRGSLAEAHRAVLAEAAPEIAEQLQGRPAQAPLRGFLGQAGFHRSAWGPGWALVGDAGYFRDPFTAHGMTDALRDAELLARAVVEGTESAFASYQATRDRLTMRFAEATDEIASFSWDLKRLNELHLVMSEAMKVEVAALQGLGGAVFMAA
jgi:menaquinone-9 beta-reductase